MSECIFCEILAARAPCHRVYEDDLTLALMDLFPVAPGHTLVIPRRHAENLFEIDADSLAAVSRASRKLARAIRKALNPDGLMVMQLNGVAAGQTVFHYHQHLIPRFGGDTLKLATRIRGNDEELRALSLRLADRLATKS